MTMTTVSVDITLNVHEWRCALCKRLLDATYEIDHIKPLHAGGYNSMANLWALHKSCRTARHLEEA